MIRTQFVVKTLTILLAIAAPAAAFDHSDWEAVLRLRVNDLGEFDYRGLADDREKFDSYLEKLAAVSPESAPTSFPTNEDKIAYWINAYNALTVEGVLRAYPVRSVRKLDRFFESAAYRLGGKTVSLDDVEHSILRKQFSEPRIHFSLVCASVSCPRLAPFAFTGPKLEEQLDARTRLFISERRNVTAEGGVILSKIFDWFKDDFRASGGVVRFIEDHGGPTLDGKRIRYRSYDWSLNRPGSRALSNDPEERRASEQTRAP